MFELKPQMGTQPTALSSEQTPGEGATHPSQPAPQGPALVSGPALAPGHRPEPTSREVHTLQQDTSA
eukprot:scaffold114190_cov46-Prasinocladus_malaysianus.AAC.3